MARGSPTARVTAARAAALAAREKQFGEVRAATRKVAIQKVEELLAIGLDAVDIDSALLLGRCCRFLSGPGGPPEVPAAPRGEGFDEYEEGMEARAPMRLPPPSLVEAPPELPRHLRDAGGRLLVPVPDEYARLEGYRWRHNIERGHGTTFRIDKFGGRGESVVCPAFCEVKSAESRPYLEAMRGSRKPVDWLKRGLMELAAILREDGTPQKLSLDGTIRAIESSPALVLVVPAGTLVFRDPPAAANFGRKAARRHPLHVAAIEMGARLKLSFVPPANTPSGDFDRVEVDLLQQRVGARLFALAGEKGRLCVRSAGGPELDPVHLLGATLDGVCGYLTGSWRHALCSSPNTWALLAVRAESSADLEVKLGPHPGLGYYAPVDGLPDAAMAAGCSFCGARPVVGIELLESPSLAEFEHTVWHPRLGSCRPVCATCSAFVPGSVAHVRKQALSQHLSSRPLDEVMGSADEGLDAALHVEPAPRYVSPPPSRGGTAGEGPEALSLARVGWHRGAIPPGAAVLAASGVVSIAAPRGGWGIDLQTICADLRQELFLAAGCDKRAVWVAEAAHESGGISLLMGFVLLHPALLGPDAMQGPGSIAIREDPKAPLVCYKRIMKYLADVSKFEKGEVLHHPRHESFKLHSPASEVDRTRKRLLLRAKDPAQLALPCSVLLCVPPDRGAVAQQVADASDAVEEQAEAEQPVTFALAMAMLKEFILTATARLAEQHHAPASKADMEAAERKVYELSEHRSMAASRHGSTAGAAVAPAPPPPDAAPYANPLAKSFECVRPNPLQLASRLRELASVGDGPRCVQVLQRWGGVDADNGVSAMLAVVGRDPNHFQGQSTVDLAVATRSHALLEALLSYLPTSLPDFQDDESGSHHGGIEDEDDTEGWSSTSFTPEARSVAGSLKDVSAAAAVVWTGPEDIRQVVRELLRRIYRANLDEEELEVLKWLQKEQLRREEAERQLAVLEAEAAVRREEEWKQDEKRRRLLQRQAWDHCVELLNQPNPITGHTPLYGAALYPNDGTVDVVQRLVGRRARVDVPSSGEPPDLPVVAAVRRGEKPLVACLLDLRADVNAKTTDGRPLLQLAVERGNVGVILAVITEPGCELDGVDSKGRTALLTALKGGRADLARLLIEKGCSVDVRDRAGAVPILHAATVRDYGLCELMLQKRANMDAEDPADGAHLLHVMAHARNEPFIRCLLAAGSDLHSMRPLDGRSLLHAAAGMRWAGLISMLLEAQAYPDWQNAVGDTPLRLAVQQGDLECAELLCRAHADPNLANRAGCAPIHAAVAEGHGAMARLLGRYGADVNLPDLRRWRPIHYGAQSGSRDVVRWLMDSGADPVARSYHGLLPQQICRGSAADALGSGPSRDFLSESSREVPELSVMWKSVASSDSTTVLPSARRRSKGLADTSLAETSVASTMAPTSAQSSAVLPPIDCQGLRSPGRRPVPPTPRSTAVGGAVRRPARGIRWPS